MAAIPKLLRPREVVAELERRGIYRAVDTLAKMRCRGDGPPFCRFGREIFYPDDGLQAWIKQSLSRPVRSTGELRDLVAGGRRAMTLAPDLFGHTPPAPMRVRLDRTVDRDKPCCSDIAIVGPGKSQHAAELRCESCGAHRGWMPRQAFDFITATAGRFGAPLEPITLRDSSIGDHDMTKDYDNTNSGVLFKNTEKTKEKDRDYNGSINVDGREFWLSAWIKVSKNGSKFMSLSVKPKETATNKPKASVADDLNDEIPF
jgi:hypothetical protein